MPTSESRYVSPVPKLTVELDIPTPKEGWPVGIEPPTTPTPVAIVPIRMRDRIVPHLGVEFDAVSTPTFVALLATRHRERALVAITNRTNLEHEGLIALCMFGISKLVFNDGLNLLALFDERCVHELTQLVSPLIEDVQRFEG